MVETVKTRAALLAEMADGGDNTAEEVRNGIVSMWTPDWVRHLNHRLPDETPHTDDDFFTSDTSADYTEITPTGTADWGISNGLLGAIVDDQATGDVAGFLKEITSASAPMTIEARITAWVPWVDNPHFGIVFTDGVAATSNLAGVGLLGSDASGQAGGVFWTSGTFTVGSTGTALTFAQGHGQFTVYLRVIWKSANTWQAAMSLDGKRWFNNGLADQSKTLTPTHIGFFAGTWGQTNQLPATFDYLRVYDADLSP